MLNKIVGIVIAASLGFLGFTSTGFAQEKIKIGIVGPFSGPFATAGVQFKQGIEAYQTLHGTRVGNREIEVLYRDVGGTNPAIAKRLTEELIVKDKVSLLGGYYLSPEAYASAPVVTETKTPAVLFLSSSPAAVSQSPYFVRLGGNSRQYVVPAAEWAVKKGLKRAYIAVADYTPGHDVQSFFKAKFTSLGGQVVGEDRIPLNTVDFAPYAERIANAKPDVVDVFIPSGAPAVNFYRALAAQGVLARTTMIGVNEADDPDLKLFDKSIVGTYSSIYYALGIDNEANRKFKETIRSKFGADTVPNFAMVSAYDAMHLFYRMVAAQQGSHFNPDVAMSAVKGYSWESPRGPVKVEQDTRDLTENIYIRRVQDVQGKLEAVISETFNAVPSTP
jgi:branched-chain amino acid transport system substrate-binding protein